MNDKQKAQQTLASELAQIHAPVLRAFVLTIFEKCTPEYFWDAPASSSGKYHPAISNGPGGLVRHTRYAVWWGQQLLRAYNREDLSDLVIGALLVHDVRKFGETMPERGGDWTGYRQHGPLMAEAIDALRSSEEHKHVIFDALVSAVKDHMGIWTEPNPPARLEHLSILNQIVMLADYCASQKANEAMNRIAESWETSHADRGTD